MMKIARRILVVVMVAMIASTVWAANNPLGLNVQGCQEVGTTATNQRGVLMAGQGPGNTVQLLQTDASGNIVITPSGGSTSVTQGTTPWTIQGPQAVGAAITANPVVVAGQQGGNVKLLLLDANGQPTVNQGTVNGAGTNSWAIQGAAGAGGAVAGNPILNGISDGTNVQTQRQAPGNLNTMAVTGVPIIQMGVTNGTDVRAITNPNNIGDGSALANSLSAGVCAFNGASWDRTRCNQSVSIHTSASTGTGTVNTDVMNPNGRFLIVHANVGSYGAAGTLLLKVQRQDANGVFVDIPGATTGALTTGTDLILTVGPNTWPANAAPVFYADQVVPRNFRIVTTVGVNAVTFSSDYDLEAS